MAKKIESYNASYPAAFYEIGTIYSFYGNMSSTGTPAAQEYISRYSSALKSLDTQQKSNAIQPVKGGAAKASGGKGGLTRYYAVVVSKSATSIEIMFLNDDDGKESYLTRKYAVSKSCATDGKDLINDPDVDAVFIVSPGFAHTESLLQAIEAGKRVFCEKPLATTADDCKKIVEAEVASGKHLIQLGFMRRYDKGYVQVKEALKSGEYGEPLILHCTHRNPEVGTNYNTPMAVHDTAIHEIDTLHWLVDDEYESAQVIMPKVTKYSHSELKDPQIMLLRTKRGICIDVEVFVNCKFGYDINCEVVCEDGAIKMAQPSYPSIRKDAAVSTKIDTDCFVRFKDAYDTEVQNWVDCAKDGVINGPTAWDGYLAAVTADALVKAQETGQIEPIHTDEKPEFYK